MCSILREPRRVEYTICTVVAPDAVFTVRTTPRTKSLRAPVSVQNQRLPATNTQVNALNQPTHPNREPSQVISRCQVVRDRPRRTPQTVLELAQMASRNPGLQRRHPIRPSPC